MKSLLIILAVFVLNCQPNNENSSINPTKIQAKTVAPENDFQNGDLIFHTSTSGQSLAIQIASKSKYSHVGMIYQKGEKYYVYEAVQPVKLTPIKEFINRGKGKHFVTKRLKASEKVLTADDILEMKKIAKEYLNKNYDLKFEWSDDKIYCSELVWKIYKHAFNIEIGELQQLKDFDLSDPVVQAKVKERYGDNIPMEEWVITPDRMFQSDKLETIIEE